MIIEKGLLLKGLGVCAICAGGTTVALKWGDIKGLFSSSSSEGSVVSPEGIKKVRDPSGLECEESEGGNCTIGEKVLVKRGDDAHFELTTLGEGKGKIKRYKDDTYEGGYKFLIEEGDINGTGETNKLEEFETYEVKKGTDSEKEEALKGKHYLSRKTDAKAEIKKALGLSCDLPAANTTTENCQITDNKVGSVTIAGGNVTLSISTDSSKDEFPLGYKFTFKNTNNTNDATLTVGGKNITLKNNSPVEFKIKKEGTSLSLEKAWTIETLASKVGMTKEADGYWFVGNSGMNIKLGSTKKTKLPKYYDPKGRVKVYEGEAGYNEGLRFAIEKGDLDLKEEGQNQTNTYILGQFQSFEVVKEENTWYLSKKDEGIEKIKKELGFECEFPTDTATPKECNLTTENIKKIKFDGKGNTEPTLSGSPKLTIHKDSGRLDYPLGYKFVFSSDNESTITISSQNSITLKSNLSYEYKIKSSGENNQTITLERAWTPENLMVGAAGFAAGNNNEWSEAGESGISIKQDNSSASGAETTGTKNAKIRVYEGTPGYNQGMKFVVEDGDTELTSSESVKKLTKYETYEVIKDTDKQWYFKRKQKAEDSIRELLGLPSTCSMPTTTDCELDDSALKAIKFEGKGNQELTITGDGNSVKLSISKITGSETEYPLGFKFTFKPDTKSFTIPQTVGEQITVGNGSNTEFKIKVGERSNLTLEKAK